MSTSIFVCLPTELVGLHHVDKSRLELKVAIDLRSKSSADVVRMGAENSRIDFSPRLRTLKTGSSDLLDWMKLLAEVLIISS